MKALTETCPGCGGSGTNPGQSYPPGGGGPDPVETTCLMCAGGGRVPHGELSDDLIDFLTDLRNKVDDIWEKVNE